jgi:hypothetical protein
LPPLYKYLPSKYLEAFVKRGELLFRSLSYFKNYEELQVRGDRDEGKRLFQPSQGLEVTKTETGEKLLLPWAFEASVKDREIFVFCMSLQQTPELANEFKTDTCVEIQDPVALLSRVRSALALRRWVKHGRLLHGTVDYYSPAEPPLAEWAVPERMIMRKTADYRHQQEYRLAFGRGDALKVNNVDVQITSTPGAVQPTLEGHPMHVLTVGSLVRICRVHTVA